MTKNQTKFTNNQVLCSSVRLFVQRQATQELFGKKILLHVIKDILLSVNIVFELGTTQFTLPFQIILSYRKTTNIILMCLYFALQRRKYCQLTSTYTFPNLLMKFVIRLCMKPPLAHHKSFRDCEYNFANGKSSLFFSIDRLGIWESAHILCKTGSCSFKHQGINLLMTLRGCNSNLKNITDFNY